MTAVTDEIAPVADHVASTLGTGEARLYEQLNTGFNWVLASLFTANGGALVALVGNDRLAAHPPRQALMCFAAGVICSILMGLGNLAYAAKAILPTTDVHMTFVAFQSGQASFEELQQKIKALEGFGWLKWAPYFAALLSLASLVCGMVVFGRTL